MTASIALFLKISYNFVSERDVRADREWFSRSKLYTRCLGKYSDNMINILPETSAFITSK